jgi:drug/metabolite transporter (DMT)-like permease
MAATRFLTAGLLLCLWARASGASQRKEESWAAALVVGLLLFLIGNGGVVVVEQWVPSGLAALMVSGTPFWFALFEWLAPGGKRPAVAVIIGIAVGFCGVALLVDLTDIRAGSAVDPKGAVILLLSSIAWSAGSVYARRIRISPSPLMVSGMQMLSGSLFLAAASVLTGELRTFDISAVSLSSGLSLLYLTLFGSIIAFTSYSWLVKATTPSRLATYAYVNPAVAVFVGWAFAGEPITARTLLAMALIVAAVMVIQSRSHKN